MRSKVRAITAVASVVAFSAISVAPASASNGTLQNVSARLVAKGAGVSISVTVTCAGYTDYNLSPSSAVDVAVGFTQAVRRGNITTGSSDPGFQNLCDGAPHTVTFLVTPSPYAAVMGSSIITTTLTYDTFGGLPSPDSFTNVVNVTH